MRMSIHLTTLVSDSESWSIRSPRFDADALDCFGLMKLCNLNCSMHSGVVILFFMFFV